MEFENLENSSAPKLRKSRVIMTPKQIFNVEMKGYVSRYTYFDIKRSWQKRYKTQVFKKQDINEFIDDLPVGTKIKINEEDRKDMWYIRHRSLKLIYNHCDEIKKKPNWSYKYNYIIYEKIDPIIITI